ncbi:TfoX N-terminal domain protein [Leptospira inadai serovar Lyme str. 10]|uniref:TfoX N-terminal domain protein n=2 Tax=Leptospira inadai serovar Lyme TaxID=293084 RepID=V6HN20_9LEPT|nr:TfoX/Sxy family protein [Leptospira inadai]EQA38290.1 TfoX N-terminal domain protein [Leptospira inadai serovar Lyme str. 10]PNV74404.1 competence protein TfoX [Leptospira inadai serovar Lyme]
MSSFLEYAQDRLKVCGPITVKSMFGGYGVYSGNHIFGMIINDLLYFKVGPGNQAEYEAASMSPFTYEGKNGKPIRMSYWQVPEEILEDDEDLRYWFRKAMAEAAKAASPKKKVPVKKSAPKKKGIVAKKKLPAKKKKAAKKKVAAKKKSVKKR